MYLIILARYLGPEEFGILNYLLAYYSYLMYLHHLELIQF